MPIPEPPTTEQVTDGQTELEADVEIAVATLEPTHSLFVAREGWLVAAVELVSPQNKDRCASRAIGTGRYAGYLLQDVHLLLVDVHPRPYRFSFADAIAGELEQTYLQAAVSAYLT